MNKKFVVVLFLIILLAALAVYVWWYFIGQRKTDLPMFTIENEKPQVSVLIKNLEVPWAGDFLDNKTLIFTERTGSVKIVNLESQNVENVSNVPDVLAESESGLLGIAKHPKFSENDFIYIYSTYSDNGIFKNKVTRHELKNNIFSNPKIIIEDLPGSPIHNGGRIKFGPDGKLYIPTGDSGVDTLAQDSNSLAGKILRLNDDGSIPDDNPFLNSPIYSLGHRNPQGLAWDSKGNLWETEHGQTATDEVNLIEKGKNFGWPEIRGEEIKEGLQNPVLHSGNATWAPSGMSFIENSLFFVGLRGQSLFKLDPESKSLNRYFEGNFGRLREVLVGPEDLIYIFTNNRDGRGIPSADDDQILVINPKKL